MLKLPVPLNCPGIVRQFTGENKNYLKKRKRKKRKKDLLLVCMGHVV
jgi:hypothetical protein